MYLVEVVKSISAFFIPLLLKKLKGYRKNKNGFKKLHYDVLLELPKRKI